MPSVTPQPLVSYHTLKFEQVGKTSTNCAIQLSASGEVSSDGQMRMNAWARGRKGKFARKERLQTKIKLCQELEWNVQIDRQCTRQFAEILIELAGLGYFGENIIASPSQYDGTSHVPSTPPPTYQKIDQQTEMRVTCSLEGTLWSPVAGVEDLDERVEWVPACVVPVLLIIELFQDLYKKRSSVPRDKPSIRRSFKFKVKLMDIFCRKPRAF